MGQVKVIEIEFDQDGKSPAQPTHGLLPYGVTNPGTSDVIVWPHVGFHGDEKMYGVFDKTGKRQLYELRGESFCALDPASFSDVERIALFAERPSEGDARPDSLRIVLAFRD